MATSSKFLLSERDVRVQRITLALPSFRSLFLSFSLSTISVPPSPWTASNLRASYLKPLMYCLSDELSAGGAFGLSEGSAAGSDGRLGGGVFGLSEGSAGAS